MHRAAGLLPIVRAAGWKRGVTFATLLSALYGALYGLLLSEDNALVLGSTLLFVILAAIMVLTRRIDWYAAGTALQPPGNAAAIRKPDPSSART